MNPTLSLTSFFLIISNLWMPMGLAQSQVNVAAAEKLIKKSGCMHCHAVTAKKEGPAFKSTAEKYKGQTDAEALLLKHLTTNPTITVDGQEELHDSVETKNAAELMNLIRYILSR